VNPSYGPVFIPAIALIGALVHIGLTRHRTPERTLTIALLWGLVVALGVGEIVTAGSHLLFGPATAAQIGFPAGNPFQTEVGVANLSYGVLGIACYWLRGGFWTATVLGYLVYFWGCGIDHIYQYAAHGNTAPYNWGPIVPIVFGVPLVLAILLVALHRVRRRPDRPAQAPTGQAVPSAPSSP